IVESGVQNPAQCNAGFVVFPDPLSPNVLVVNSSTGNGLSYFWDFGDGATSTEAYPSYSYSGTGPFELCITVNDGAGCSDTYCDSIGSNGIVLKVGSGFSINVISPLQVGIEQQESSIGSIGIFPNPVSTQLNILNPQSVVISEIRIVDMTGRIVNTVKKNTNAVDVSFLPSGVYFIEFVSETGTVIEKFVKR
ncbi:MAG: T9SS type A sorting domain-containing protein, partial [Flavobacteriales bacterium]|nr:T9SS type A sorting domain-containing protein [Flavobacteriales bacterium]